MVVTATQAISLQSSDCYWRPIEFVYKLVKALDLKSFDRVSLFESLVVVDEITYSLRHFSNCVKCWFYWQIKVYLLAVARQLNIHDFSLFLIPNNNWNCLKKMSSYKCSIDKNSVPQHKTTATMFKTWNQSSVSTYGCEIL